LRLALFKEPQVEGVVAMFEGKTIRDLENTVIRAEDANRSPFLVKRSKQQIDTTLRAGELERKLADVSSESEIVFTNYCGGQELKVAECYVGSDRKIHIALEEQQ
jgi:hypothetical protein